MKDTNLEVWRWTLRATPRLPLRRKHPEKQHLCVQPSQKLPLVQQERFALLRRQCALHGCKGFLPRTGVMSGTSAKCTFHTIFCEWYQAALGQPQWRNEGHQPGSLEMDTSGHSKATVKKKTSRKATSMCPTLPEIAACPARKIRLLRRQCALHGCKGFLPRTGVMSGTSAKCTFRTIFCEWYQAALGQPQWRNEGHQPGSLEIDTSGHSKATVKKKTSRKATSMCPTLPEIAACHSKKDSPFKASMCLAWLQGFSTSNGGYVRYLCQVHLSHHLLRVISGSARAAPMAKWRTPTWKFGDGHFGPLQGYRYEVQPSQKLFRFFSARGLSVWTSNQSANCPFNGLDFGLRRPPVTLDPDFNVFWSHMESCTASCSRGGSGVRGKKPGSL